MEGLIGLAVLAVLAVPVLLVIALVKVSGLRGRVAYLEAQVAGLWQALADQAQRAPTLAEQVRAASATQRESAPSDAPADIASRAPEPDIGQVGAVAPHASSMPMDARSETDTPARAVPASMQAPPSATRATFEVDDPAAPFAREVPPPLPPPVQAPARPAKPPAVVRLVKRWFTEGNVPVKVGVLVLFAGVAALMKYATDAGWLRVPMELRLAGIAFAAIGALVFAWRKRESNRTFALSLQGGAIGVLLLVVFAAFKLYGLIPAAAAFALSVVLVAGTGVLAVKQDALALAVFGLLAGFLAPLWLSTGSGNHVALFGYYAVLNVGIFAIAWWRAWRVLNLLGFVFTFGIGALWGATAYTAQHYDTTQPFLALFFVLYLLLPLLYARRRAPARNDAIDGTLVFGTPLVAFSLQAALLEGDRLPLAFCALGLGAVYAGLAAMLRRSASMQPLVTPYAILSVAFATLAVPLALSAQATACVFAVEGAALCWLGLRQQRVLPQVVGVLLQGAAAFSFAIASFPTRVGEMAVLNAQFAAALLIAVSGFATATVFRRAERRPIALAFYLWSLAWWLLATLGDMSRFVQDDFHTAIGGVVLLATGALAIEAHARLQPSRALAWTFTAAMLLGVPLALALDVDSAPALGNLGWLAAIAYVIVGLRGLRVLRDMEHAPVGLAHGAWWVSMALFAALLLRSIADDAGLGSGWQWAGFALPWLALLAAIDHATRTVATPIGARFEDSRGALRGLVAGVVVLGASIALFDSGDASPLPWIALVNPLDLSQLVALALVARITLMRDPAARGARLPWLAGGAFALITAITLRATHHWGGLAWSIAMVDTSLVQTSLSIVWSVLGVAGWIVGSRRGQRGVWIAGAVLMGVVLAKLVLVDREHLGNLLGIASFLAYGLLCVAVGYFAPAPPRQADPAPEPA